MDGTLWEQAWAERPRLLGIARRRCRSRSDAEEIVSEAILRCVTMPDLDPDRLAAVLTAVTMRLCVDDLRERAIAERNAHRLFARAADPADEVLDRAEAMWLAAEVAKLAGRERAAMTARVLGLTVAETAEVLGVTYRAAEGLLGRARRKLRDAWTGTLAVLPVLRRRRVPIVAVAAVAAAVTLAVTRPWARPEVLRLPAVQRAQTAPVPVHVPAPTIRRVPAVARRPASPVSAPARHPASLVTPDLRLGPVRVHPSVVTLDLTDPVGRVRRCLRDGVAVEIAARVAAVCK